MQSYTILLIVLNSGEDVFEKSYAFILFMFSLKLFVWSRHYDWVLVKCPNIVQHLAMETVSAGLTMPHLSIGIVFKAKISLFSKRQISCSRCCHQLLYQNFH